MRSAIRADWQLWAALMAGALLLRVVFYTGYFGSDEVTYTESAFKLLHGDWTAAQYVGANRYGVNLPVAGFAWLFGENEFAAALYSLICSLAEVALVFGFGRELIGRRAAFLAAAMLASLPIHVHSAGRLMADAPLSLAITASFLCFWAGEARGRITWFVCAGLAAGLAFWIKPHAMVYLAVFASYPIVFRRWDWRWAWMLAAFLAVVLANTLLFWILTGNPLFLIDAVRARQTSGYLESGMAAGAMVNAPLYYLNYLFLNIYHTWLAPYLAVLAVVSWLAARHRASAADAFTRKYLVWWAFGLVALFSLFVVSWRPLILIPKQTNYMLMFVAPFTLLAGQAMAQLRGARLGLVSAFVLVPSVLLAGMQQNSIRVFTANSKAALEFSRSHADSDVFVNTNALRAATFNNLVKPREAVANVRFIGDLTSAARGGPSAGGQRHRYAIVDTETLSWAAGEPIASIDAVPSCWTRLGVLQPIGMGWGSHMLDVFRPLASALPGRLHVALSRRLDQLVQPAPAYLFEIPADRCDLKGRPPGR